LIAEARIAKETIRLGSLQQAQAAMMDRPVCSSCKGTKFVTVELKHSKVNEPCPKCHPDFKNESQPVVQKPTLTHNPFSKVLKRDDS
jgi:hypothetical protein